VANVIDGRGQLRFRGPQNVRREMRATVLGKDSQIEWTVDSTAVPYTLDRGHPPPFPPFVPSSMLVSA